MNECTSEAFEQLRRIRMMVSAAQRVPFSIRLAATLA